MAEVISRCSNPPTHAAKGLEWNHAAAQTTEAMASCDGDTAADARLAPVAISIVSHGHGEMVSALIEQLRRCPEVGQVIVTRNVPETTILAPDSLVELRDNAQPKGYGANHNAAFRHCRRPYFCVMNPDIQFIGNPFPELLSRVGSVGRVIAAPLVLSPGGDIEDSARRFPTIGSLMLKLLFRWDGGYAIERQPAPIFPEWVAGMFMLFRSTDFAELAGFDERYFLYYEDVDICERAWRLGMKVMLCPGASVIHEARRQSRHSLAHLRWHLASLARFLLRTRAGK